MTLLLALLACNSPKDCLLGVAASHLECEEDADCVLVPLDCGQACTCGAVTASASGDYSDASPADCDDVSCTEPCEADCRDVNTAACVRNECVVLPVGVDTFQ